MPKAIIFDFGNVLFDLNLSLFYQNISELLDFDISKGLPPSLVKLVEQYDAGTISTAFFIQKIKDFKNTDLDSDAIVHVWNSMLIGFPKHRWDFLGKIKAKFDLFLLSNINEMHYDVIQKHIREEHQILNFEKQYFDDVFYSHIIHLIKPNEDIYHFVENKIGRKGEEIFFIDDKAENIEMAKKVGWQARLHDPNLDIMEVFEVYMNELNPDGYN